MNKGADSIYRGIESILPENSLKEKIKVAERENRPLVVKLGFDPTAPDLHLGHAVVLKKLKEFQDLNHKIVVIIGDFTASIGDPSGKNKTRPPLSVDQIKENAKTYLDQLYKILDPAKTEVKFNSEWLDKLTLRDTIQLMSCITVSGILQREDFSNRYNNNISISMHELLYPLLQGYDSCIINADVEIGGTDQIFNCLLGRELQKNRNLVQQIVVAMPLLRGTDGEKKMSKSLGNYIALTDNPNDMYGKVMSLPDSLIEEYINLATSFDTNEKKLLLNDLKAGLHEMDIKKLIAQNIVSFYHSEADGIRAKMYFEQQFQSKNFEEKKFEKVIISEKFSNLDKCKIIELVSILVPTESKSKLRGLIRGGGVMINGKKIIDPIKEIGIENGLKIKIGKRFYYEFVTN